MRFLPSTIGISCAILLSMPCLEANSLNQPQATAKVAPQRTIEASFSQKFVPTDFSHLIGMPGFTKKLLTIHFKLYQGYVKNTNALNARLRQLSEEGKDRTPEYAGLKRMYGWEFGGMRLHEYYFSNLGGKGSLDPSSPLYENIVQDFGGYEKWKRDFIATGMMRGIGWAILYYDPTTGRLANTWINEHDIGHLAGGIPILVMDVFEHAYMPQYGLDRQGYIDAFFNNINWDAAIERYNLCRQK